MEAVEEACEGPVPQVFDVSKRLRTLASLHRQQLGFISLISVP